MLKYIFAGVFIALAWAVVLVFGLPLWPAIAATGAIIAILGLVVLLGVLKSKRAAAKIERGIEEQGKRHAKGGRPDRQHEIASMQEEFRKAVRSLKTSKLGRGGGDALATLPWYVIVGPPGGGKTTALLNSGIKMPYQAKRGVRGVGGTRNCDWWLTNHAIILDTAGRWTTEDDDHEEWLAFLDLMKRTRPRKPLNGVLLAVAVDRLEPDEDKLTELAEKLRERLDEITQRLDVVLPVYLLVTKCDLLPGFTETFGELRDKDRGQIWGLTLPLAASSQERHELLGERLDELESVIEKRALLRMADERRLDARRSIYELPQQFGALKGSLGALLENLFPENAFEDTAVLRGVYFTSGTQVGQPIDRVVGRLAESFGLPKAPGMTGPASKPKSYFLRDMFMEVVFPDKDAAMMSSKALRKQRLTKIGVTTAACAASLAFLFVPFNAFLDNKRLIAEADQMIERLGADPPGGVRPATLEAVEPSAKRMADLAAHGPGFFARFGMYPGDSLLEPIEAAVDRVIVRPLLAQAAEEMKDYTQKRGTVDATAAVHDLTYYLLFTQPKQPEEPQPDQDAWEKRWIPEISEIGGEIWSRSKVVASREDDSARARRAMGALLELYAYRVEDTALLENRSVPIVSRTREALLGGRTNDPIEEMVNTPGMPRDLRLVDFFGVAASNFKGGDDPRGGPTVRGAFTPDGWQVVKKRIKALLDEEEVDDTAWVLGQRTKREKADAGALQSSYFRKYTDEWKRFFGELAAKSPADLEDAKSLLRAVSMQKPLEALWQRAQEHLVWKDESPMDLLAARGKSMLDKKFGEAKKKIMGDKPDEKKPTGRRVVGLRTPTADEPLVPEDLAVAFAAFLSFGTNKPSGIEAYAQSVAELLGALGEGTAPDAKVFQGTLKSVRVKLTQLIGSFNESGWEGPVLERLLLPPLTGTEVSVLGASGASANRKWCEGVVSAWEQMIEARYPFSTKPNAKDAQVAEVERFFSPKGGVLWQYYLESLASDINHPANTTTFQLKEDASIKYKPQLLAFLKRAQELTDFLFAKDPQKLAFRYWVRIRGSAGYTKIVFDLGNGIILTHQNSREKWAEAVFPSRKAFLSLVGKQTLTYGPPDREWALFRFLDDGKIQIDNDGEDFLAGSWTPPLADPVRIDVKPTQLQRLWKGFELPRSIVNGASGCGH